MLIEQFASRIMRLPPADSYTKSELLRPDFLLDKENKMEIYYAPFDFINEHARVVIVGITPGWNQMEMAFRTATKHLHEGVSPHMIGKYVKQQASLAGAMRKNLFEMLDDLGLPLYLGIQYSQSLFNKNYDLLHPSSVIRYPVFVDGENYTGHKPAILKSSLLLKYVNEVFAKETQQVNHALFIPLGKSVASVLEALIREGLLHEEQCLLGFPHPSGANGHRRKQYEQVKEELKVKLEDWMSMYKPAHIMKYIME